MPDGYTMGFVTNGTAISVAAFKKLPFDPVTQFDMVSGLGQFNLLFAVDAKSKYKTLGDFIEDAKANPGKLNIGTIAVGGTQNLGAELFKSMADVNVGDRAVQALARHRGGAVAQRRADAGRVPAGISGQVSAGKLRVLASVRNPTRGIDAERADGRTRPASKATWSTSWNGVFAPKGTPKEVIDAMNKAMHEVLADPEVKAQYAKVGVEAHAQLAGGTDGPAQERHQEVECGDRQSGHPAEIISGSSAVGTRDLEGRLSGRWSADQSASLMAVNLPRMALLLARPCDATAFAGEEIDVATADAGAHVPILGKTGDQELAAAIDDGQSRFVLIAAHVAVFDDQRALAVAGESEDGVGREVLFDKRRPARKIERLGAGAQIDVEIRIDAGGILHHHGAIELAVMVNVERNLGQHRKRGLARGAGWNQRESDEPRQSRVGERRLHEQTSDAAGGPAGH